jgi:hypothetical protein
LLRVLLGLLKGSVIGGGLGFGFMQLGSIAQAGWIQFLFYGLIGAIVGFVCGKPFWKHDTIWTPVVKAVFGIGVAIGLYALVAKALGDPKLNAVGLEGTISSFPYVLGAAVGVVYGIFVEVDDGGKTAAKKDKENSD